MKFSSSILFVSFVVFILTACSSIDELAVTDGKRSSFSETAKSKNQTVQKSHFKSKRKNTPKDNRKKYFAGKQRSKNKDPNGGKSFTEKNKSKTTATDQSFSVRKSSKSGRPSKDAFSKSSRKRNLKPKKDSFSSNAAKNANGPVDDCFSSKVSHSKYSTLNKDPFSVSAKKRGTRNSGDAFSQKVGRKHSRQYKQGDGFTNTTNANINADGPDHFRGGKNSGGRKTFKGERKKLALGGLKSLFAFRKRKKYKEKDEFSPSKKAKRKTDETRRSAPQLDLFKRGVSKVKGRRSGSS